MQEYIKYLKKQISVQVSSFSVLPVKIWICIDMSSNNELGKLIRNSNISSYLLRTVVSRLNNSSTTEQRVSCMFLNVVYHFIGRRNRCFCDRNRLSGQHRFIQNAIPSQKHCVTRHQTAMRWNNQNITRYQFFSRHGRCLPGRAVSHHRCHVGRIYSGT